MSVKQPAAPPRFALDRSLPVRVGVQLRGQIEYAVAVGDLKPGQQLPTVRELSEALGLSPVTVSNVYRDLKAKGMLDSKVGSGTFVSTGSGPEPADAVAQAELQRAIDRLLQVGRVNGISPTAIVERLQATLAASTNRVVRALLVGVFTHATRFYAATIERELGPRGTVDACTFDDLAADPGAVDLGSYDVLLTIVYRVPELEQLAAGRVPVKAARFIPSDQTRLMLSQLRPSSKVAVVATYSDYLATLKSMVISYAPHVEVVAGYLLEEFEAEKLVAGVDVLVYATGSDDVAQMVAGSVRAFEYRHAPDVEFAVRAVLGGE